MSIKMSNTLTRCLALAVITLTLNGCGKQNDADKNAAAATGEANADVLIVKIGQGGPLTGPQAHIGKDNENAARLAIDELNTENIVIGGKKVQFELHSEDDMADPRTATLVAQKLVDDGVSGIIGHMNSGTSIPASKIYHDAGIVQISPSATAVAFTTQGFPGAMRVMANDSQQGKQLAHYAVEKLGVKKIAIIDDRTSYGQGLADVFEKTAKELGATIVKREFTTDKASDFNAILTNVKGSDAELLFYGGMDAQGAPMVKQLRALGITLPFMGGDGVYTAEFLKLAGADAEGVIGSLPGVPLVNMQGGPEFKQKFESKYGVIQLYAPYVYDATRMMAKAMQDAGSIESANYLPVLKNMEYQGITSKIKFDEKGDLIDSPVTLYKVANGQWQFIETASQTTGGK